MGENTIKPKENKNNSSSKMHDTLAGASENPTNDGEENMDSNSENTDNVDEDQNDEENEDDMTPEEFAALDNQLDALNSALDDIEQKNDDIYAQLHQLLIANREIRQQIQQTNTEKDESGKSSANEPKQ